MATQDRKTRSANVEDLALGKDHPPEGSETVATAAIDKPRAQEVPVEGVGSANASCDRSASETARTRVTDNSELADICATLKDGGFENVLVVTGAGISTAAGVPDFRSDDGIYRRLEKLNLETPEQVFDIDYFREDPTPFYALAQELRADSHKPTSGHCFIKLLDDKSRLPRLYTQNIDGLDIATGLERERVIEAHGSFATASCIDCGNAATEQALESIRTQTIPHCVECDALVKPDIVFFGEQLPDRFHRCLPTDIAKADLCIIIGTSLKVMPVAYIPEMLESNIPRVLINREAAGSLGSREKDVLALGDIEDVVRDIAEKCGWLADLETMEFPEED